MYSLTRWAVAALAASYVAATVLLGQGTATAIDPAQAQYSLLQWAIDRGGRDVILIVVLFFYRRDWQALVGDTKEQLAVLTTLVINATRAQTETADALRENNVVVHQARRVMETYLPDIPMRRDVDTSKARQ